MKHFCRWMICLGLLLNPLLFILLITLGTKFGSVFYILSVLCYPITLLLVYLARKKINANCQFYNREDSWWWTILKTILMPIVATGTLIMYHLITYTYRKTNEAIEDGIGFSVSSIFRTAISLAIYFVSGMILYFITNGIFHDSYVASDVSGGLMLFAGIVWLISYILWDVLDFADKESDGFITFKNIAFLSIGGLAAIFGFLSFIALSRNEVNYGNVVGLFCCTAAPLCMSFSYYGVIRTGQVPQSKMTYFWGPIAMALTYGYALLVGLLAAHWKGWILIFHVLTILCYVAIVYFFGFPFCHTDGEYRQTYRKIAKEKRIAKAEAASASVGSSGSSSAIRTASNAKVYDAAHQTTKVFSIQRDFHLHANAGIYSARLFVDNTSDSSVTFSLTYTLYIDLRGCSDETDAKFLLDRTKRDHDNMVETIKAKILDRFEKELAKEGIETPISVSIKLDITNDIKY